MSANRKQPVVMLTASKPERTGSIRCMIARRCIRRLAKTAVTVSTGQTFTVLQVDNKNIPPGKNHSIIAGRVKRKQTSIKKKETSKRTNNYFFLNDYH